MSSQQLARVHNDFQHLLDRMQGRQYPETLSALASYWLRTVYRNEYQRGEWRILDRLLGEVLGTEIRTAWRAPIRAIRECIREEGLLNGKAATVRYPLLPDRRRAAPDRKILLPYLVRLINEWVPKEVAHLLVESPDDPGDSRAGIPVLGAAAALERLLRRECLPVESLELLLEPGAFSPKVIYPADYEILRDVVLLLLNRTAAPVFPPIPATPLAAPGELDDEFESAVSRASLVSSAAGEEVQVPLSTGRTLALLGGKENLRIESAVITMDGRWWRASALAAGAGAYIAYRPAGRLGIDFSTDEPRLRIPWPESKTDWRGSPQFPQNLAFFGRRWRVARWEQDRNGVWLTLCSAGPLRIGNDSTVSRPHLRQSLPASVDIAWAAAETVLAESLAVRSGEPIEEFRTGALIPVLRAMHALAECGRGGSRESFVARLRSVAFHGGSIQAEYGRPRWHVFPRRARVAIHSRARTLGLEDQLREVFPEVPQQVESHFPALERWLHWRPHAA